LVAEEKNVSLVTQFIPGICLDKLILQKTLSFDDKLKITKNICSILKYIHSQKYIHRDLKPENLLVDTNNCDIYLIDFGIAKCIANKEGNVETRIMGTIFYIAPEIYDEAKENTDGDVVSYYSAKYDVWSFGCIVSYMFSGVPPWTNIIPEKILKKGSNHKDVTTQIENFLMNYEEFPIPNYLDQKIKEIVKRATIRDVSKRSDINELTSLLEKMD